MNSRFSLILAYLSGPVFVAAVLAAYGFDQGSQQPLLSFMGDLWMVVFFSAFPALVLAVSHTLLRLIVPPARRGRLNKAVLAALWTVSLLLAAVDLGVLLVPGSGLAPTALFVWPFVLAGAALPLLMAVYAGLPSSKGKS